MMNFYSFVIICLLKFLAIELMLTGLFLQLRDGESFGYLIFTFGSVLFAVTGNVLLGVFLYSKSKK